MTTKDDGIGIEKTASAIGVEVMTRSNIWQYLLPIVPLVFAIAVWKGAIAIFQPSGIIFPAPLSVINEFFLGIGRGYETTGYWYHAVSTFIEAGIGLAIGASIGLSLGILMGTIRPAEAALYPYIVALQGLPKMALAPLFIVWFGFGMESKIALVVMVTFFPVMVNTWAGIRAVNADLAEMSKVFGASRVQTFRYVTWPNALPYVFAGMDIAIPYCIVAAIIGEFLGAQRGLGFLLEKMNYDLNIAGMFGIFVLLLIIGYLANLAIRWFRKRVLFWVQREVGTTSL